MRQSVRFAVVITALALTFSARATCGGGGGGGTGGMMPNNGTAPKAYVVPWKVADGNAATAALTLYWAPAAAADVKGSDLVSSRTLTLASAQCIGMMIIHPEDTATQAKWEVTGKVPMAFLAGPDGKQIAKIDGNNGKLRLSDVEGMLNRELKAREAALDKVLDEAKQKADSGDKDAATALYTQVWEQRCLAPKKGRAAQKALGKLGVEVKDAS